MPELPEVEVTRLRLERVLAGRTLERVVVRAPKLRLPLPEQMENILPGRMVVTGVPSSAPAVNANAEEDDRGSVLTQERQLFTKTS